MRALEILGCEIYHVDERHVHLAYKATLWQAVPKRPLSATMQLNIIRALGLSEAEYTRALDKASHQE